MKQISSSRKSFMVLEQHSGKQNGSTSLISRMLDLGKMIFGVLAFLGGPILYVHGAIYYESYLEVLGLESSMFPSDTQSTLLKGYIIAIQMGSSSLVALIVVMVISYAAAAIVDVLTINKRVWSKPLFITEGAKGLALVCIGSLIATVIIFLLANSFLKAYSYGTEQAHATIEKFRHFQTAPGSSRTVALIQGESGQTRVEGFKVLCSEKWCAFFVGTKIEVYPVEKITGMVSDIPSKKP